MVVTEGEDIQIGFIWSTTKDGAVYASGVRRLTAAKLEIDRINSDPSILPDNNIVIVHYDNQAMIELATDGALLLSREIDPPVVGIIGDSSSSRTTYEAQVAAIFDVPIMSFAATSPVLSDKSRFPTFMRTIPPDTLQGVCLADLVFHFGWMNVNTLASTDDYGSKCIEAFHYRASGLGINFGLHRSFLETETDEETLRGHVAMLNNGVNIFVACSHAPPLTQLLAYAGEEGLLEVGHAWITSEAMFDSSYVGDGYIGRANILGSAPLHTNGYLESEVWNDFSARWDTAVAASDPAYDTQGSSPPASYTSFLLDCIILFAHALDEAVEVGVSPLVDRKAFLELLLSTEFTGASGNVMLNSVGDRMGSYEILNAQQLIVASEGTVEETYETVFVSVGTWSAVESDDPDPALITGSLLIDSDAVVLFSGGSVEIPSDSARASHTGSESVLIIVLIAVVALALLVVSVTLHYRSRKMARVVSHLERIVAFTPEQKDIINTVMNSASGSAELHTSKLSFEEVLMTRKIGGGAFGDVWLGTCNGVPCAIKRLLPDRITEENVLVFKREIQLVRRLHHPNIIQFFGACWDPPNIFLVLELAERGSLNDALKAEPPMTWKGQKALICLQIAEAMNYLHTLSPPVMHRDLKSHNILIMADGLAKVGDFGAGREDVEATAMTQIGSQFWLPPEIYLGENYDASCDVYSFAIVLCEMFSKGGSVINVFHELRSFGGLSVKVVQGWRPCLAEVEGDLSAAPGLRKLIEHCWQTNPAFRPSFHDIIVALRDIQRRIDAGLFETDTVVGMSSERLLADLEISNVTLGQQSVKLGQVGVIEGIGKPLKKSFTAAASAAVSAAAAAGVVVVPVSGSDDGTTSMDGDRVVAVRVAEAETGGVGTLGEPRLPSSEELEVIRSLRIELANALTELAALKAGSGAAAEQHSSS